MTPDPNHPGSRSRRRPDRLITRRDRRRVKLSQALVTGGVVLLCAGQLALRLPVLFGGTDLPVVPGPMALIPPLDLFELMPPAEAARGRRDRRAGRGEHAGGRGNGGRADADLTDHGGTNTPGGCSCRDLDGTHPGGRHIGWQWERWKPRAGEHQSP